MFCQSCGSKLGDYDRFCAVCGAAVEASRTEQAQTPVPTQEYSAAPTRVYGSQTARVHADAFDGGGAQAEVDDRTVVVDAQYAYQDRYAEPLNPDNPYPIDVSRRQEKAPADYQDSFVIQNTPRFRNSGWEDPSHSTRKQYHPTTAGRRVASFFVCLLMLLFGFLALLIGTSRIAFTQSNVRSAYGKGTLADLKIDTEEGEKTLAQILMDNVVDSKTNLPISLQEAEVNVFLKGSRVNTFVENLVVDFTQFFIFGRTPSLLNGAAVTDFLTTISDDVEKQISYSMSDEDIRYIGRRVDGGDLSFLSIDENGGYFKQKYGVDPYVISSLFSVWMLVICAGLALVSVILVFVINHGNLPAGLGFNGRTMIVFGVLNTVIAAALLILSFVKKIFLLSELLRGFALAMGGVSIAVLLIGVVFSVIKTVLKNRL